MDEDIRTALADVKQTIRDGFSTTNGQIKELITRGEFNATVQRLDSEAATLRRDFTAHEAQSERHTTAMHEADAKVMADAKTSIDAVKAELHTNLEGFRVTTRWAIGLSATIAGLIVGAVSVIVTIFINTL